MIRTPIQHTNLVPQSLCCRALEDLGKLEPGDEVNSRVKDLRRRLKRAVVPMDYYAVLGVSSNCSIADIKVSYRKMAMRFHPDRPGCNHGVIFQYISQVNRLAFASRESRCFHSGRSAWYIVGIGFDAICLEGCKRAFCLLAYLQQILLWVPEVWAKENKQRG